MAKTRTFVDADVLINAFRGIHYRRENHVTPLPRDRNFDHFHSILIPAQIDKHALSESPRADDVCRPKLRSPRMP